MEPTRQDNSINAFKEARNLFNERKKAIFLVKKQMKLEKTFIKRKQSIIF